MDSFIRCRELAGQFLTKQRLLPTGYKFRTVKRSKSVKRKAIDSDDESDDIYDGIKRLYSEDVAMETSVAMRLSCGKEVGQHQDIDPGSSFCIPTVSAN